MRLAPLAAIALLVAACGGAAAPSLAPSASPAAPSASVAASTIPGALTFRVGSGSKATVRAREQLARLTSPSDAVLTTSAVSGSFTLLPDGTFSPDSKITADLAALQSDQEQRDNFIKRNTLQTTSFPNATFVPRKTIGLALPLPPSGGLSFEVEGQLSVHGVSKDATFEVKATRTAGTVNATATHSVTFEDFGMQVPRVAVVLSVVDKLDLEVALVAIQAQ